MSTPAVQAEAQDIGREAVTALNEAALLRDVLVREIRALGALYVVGKRRPLTELPPEKQEQVRQAYADTSWASDYCVEMQGVFTSQALAEDTCKAHGPNWFFTRLPIDSCLPEEVVFGEWAHQFPGSDAREIYENLEAATMAVPVTQMRAITEEIQRLQRLVDAIRGSC